MKGLLIGLTGLLILAVTPVYTQDGSFDIIFGDNGWVISDLDRFEEEAYALSIQADGKAVVAGRAHNGFNFNVLLARYLYNGDLDPDFGEEGFVMTDIAMSNEEAFAVLTPPGGHILVAGYTCMGADGNVLILCYDQAGVLDENFGTGGFVILENGPYDDLGFDLAMQSDGKILIGGQSHNGADYDYAVWRINSDGSPDPYFGVGGLTTIEFGNNDDFARKLQLLDNGDILVTGYSDMGPDSDFSMALLNSSGELNPDFGNNGILTVDVNSEFNYGFASLIQPDGKILLGGFTSSHWGFDLTLLRFNADGTVDNYFGEGGVSMVDIAGRDDFLYDLELQPDAKILAAGYTVAGALDNIAVLRFNSDGSLDPSFSEDGIFTWDLNGNDNKLYDIELLNSGKLMAAGYSYNGKDNDVTLIRLNAYTESTASGTENISRISKVWPNPFSDFIAFEFETTQKTDITVQLIDMNGRLVATLFNGLSLDPGSFTRTENIPDELPPGMYFLKFTTDHGQLMYKVIKE